MPGLFDFRGQVPTITALPLTESHPFKLSVGLARSGGGKAGGTCSLVVVFRYKENGTLSFTRPLHADKVALGPTMRSTVHSSNTHQIAVEGHQSRHHLEHKTLYLREHFLRLVSTHLFSISPYCLLPFPRTIFTLQPCNIPILSTRSEMLFPGRSSSPPSSSRCAGLHSGQQSWIVAVEQW
jgi:hypothetical protein